VRHHLIPRRQSLLALAALAVAACSSGPAFPPPGNADGGAGGTSSASSGATSTSTSSSASGGGADASAPALRVLFVGNSYIFVNDLPTVVKQLADSAGLAQLTVDSVTVGGATFADQLTTTGAVDRIRQGGWTHVVLQAQSVEPLYDPATFASGAAALAAEVEKVGAAPVFYETWARKAGDAVYQQTWSGGTPAAMQAGLRTEYQKVATAAGAVAAPAGDAWETTLAQQPAIVLFQSDGSHPTIDGTYLVACVFHATLTGHSPVGIAAHPPAISAAEAATLQAIAAATTGAPP